MEKTDSTNIAEVERITAMIDNITPDYVHKISDKLYKYQPYLISLVLGDQVDFTPLEAEEMLKFYLMLWEYYQDKKNIKKVPLSAEKFRQKQSKNIEYFNYLEKESKEGAEFATNINIANTHSKYLLGAILKRFQTRPVLVNMPHQNRVVFLISCKSLVECFDDIVLAK
ncbi:hypothetical protein [Microscilla marina]|uniref:Uncharacterized protein n=1 Tax=Microscilla marina ATCC 23134 TaxID=313606 RepID=A1ZP61_MICM2|nr:hypothetical protein [Microscilla marina]EAY27853.1 hypothetical protein M23134_00294 [Microscilla marina ATCC 23134]